MTVVTAPLRTLIVGVGTRGKHWVRLAQEEPATELVGFMDINPSSLDWVQEAYLAPSSACFTDLEVALRVTQPELAILATPPAGHRREASLVFAAGSHLLCEKPLATTFEDAVAIVRESQSAETTLTVGLNFRYLNTTRKALELIQDEVGRPSFARFIYWRYRDGRRPGINKYPLTMRQPMLYEQSIHHLDLLRFVYNAEVERVWCRTHNPPWSMYRDDATVTCLLEMAGGLLVDYFGTWSGRTGINEFLWRTDCERGTLLQREQFSNLSLIRAGSAVEERIDLPPQEDFIDDTRAMLADIARQLVDGTVTPTPSGIDHLKTMALTAACDKSAQSGLPVVIREFYQQHDVPIEWLD